MLIKELSITLQVKSPAEQQPIKLEIIIATGTIVGLLLALGAIGKMKIE